MPLADDLGNLILNLNPYTNRNIPDTNPQRSMGQMDPYVKNAVPAVPPAGNSNQMEIELDGPYRQEWTFKGEPQKVGMAYRIKYRFPVNMAGAGAPLFWLEDYILIGFEGGMGG